MSGSSKVMRAIMLIVGIALIVGGITCFVLGAKAANNEMLMEAFGNNILPVVLYSIGPLIAFCGVLKVLHTYSGNYKLAWCFLSIEIPLFLIGGGILLALYYNGDQFRNDLKEEFQESCRLEKGVYLTFLNLKRKEGLIFTGICRGETKLQDCSETDLRIIFLNPPEEKEMNILGAMEETFKCAGLCGIKLSKYMFSDVNMGDPTGSCDENLAEFLENLVGQVKKWMPVIFVFAFIAIIDIFYVMYTCCCRPRKPQYYTGNNMYYPAP